MARIGNRNAAKGRQCREALRKVLAQYEDDTVERGQALRKVYEGVVQQALDPESKHYEFAVKEIGQRIDGSAKESGESATHLIEGISAAFAALSDFAAQPKIVYGETIVPDRSVLPSQVRAQESGHGEGVDLPEGEGGPEEP